MAWGSSFHFCRHWPGERFQQAMARHEHFLALKMKLNSSMRVLDLGCGVGGPAREIAKFVGCQVVCLNINQYQLTKAMAYTRKQGLERQIAYVRGDFTKIPFADNIFDAVLGIDATVHGPGLVTVYKEAQRVLKQGGIFGVQEWVMLPSFDVQNQTHRQLRLGIEKGCGIAAIEGIADAVNAIAAAGLELLEQQDLCAANDSLPWYYPLSGELRYLSNLWDIFTMLRMTKFGRNVFNMIQYCLETVKLAPAGTGQVAENLVLASDSIVESAKIHIFSPMYLLIAQKP